jgi:OFA family oxalate/formate antiporter-like MFS transporter
MHYNRKIASLCGCFLYMIFLGTPYIIGSLIPYLSGYFKVTATETQLLLPTLILMQTLVMPFGGYLASRHNPKFLIIIGAIICLSCLYICSCLAPNQFTLFKYVFSFGYAIDLGLTYMIPVQIGWSLFPNRTGLVSGIVIGGYGLGNIIFSKLSTLIVNPNNLS